jgi:hypothetical protein
VSPYGKRARGSVVGSATMLHAGRVAGSIPDEFMVFFQLT